MNVAIGLLMAAALGVWVYSDARTRGASRPALWGIGTFLIAIVVLPLWLFLRPRDRATPRTGPRLCTFCAEAVQPTAVVCMHCGRDLPPGSAWPGAR